MQRQAAPTANCLSPMYRLEGAVDPWSDWFQTAMLVKHLTRRHLAARYRGSLLGFIWSFLNPLLMMGVYTFVFRFVFRATVPGIPYPAFFLTGILAWNFFSIAVMNATTSVADNAFLLNKHYFPRIVLPVSAICSNALNYLTVIPLLLVFNGLYGMVPSRAVLLLPLAFALLVCVATAVGLLTAGLAPFFRDLVQLLEVVLMAWFFATPVLYPMSFLESHLSAKLWILYHANPMVGAIRLMHAVFLGQPVPVSAVAMATGVAVCLLGVGLWAFSRQAPHFSEA